MGLTGNAWISLAILAATITTLVFALTRSGSRNDDTEQSALDEEQAQRLTANSNAR